MVQFNFDEHNAKAYDTKTKSIERAIELILDSADLKLTVSELARVSGYSRNTIKDRGYNRETLKGIESSYATSKETDDTESDRLKLKEAKCCIKQLQKEVAFWFSKAASAYEIEQDFKNQTSRTIEAFNETKKDADNLRSQVASLIDERNKLQEIIRELS